MLYNSVFNRGPEVYPDKVALVDGTRRFTYADAGARWNRLANALLGLGLEKGDRIGVLMKNCAEWVDVYAAAAKIGVVVGGINYRLPRAGLKGVLQDLGCRAVLVDPASLAVIHSLRSELPFLQCCICVGREESGFLEYESLLSRFPATAPTAPVNDDDPANIVYTSGTTGEPKGCVTSRRTHWMRSCSMAMNGEIRPEDVYVNAFPLFHVAVNVTLAILLRGGTNVMMNDWDAREFCRLVQEQRITRAFLAPSVLNLILNFPDLDRYDLSSLGLIGYGASPMPPEILRKAMQRLPACRFVQTYGGSETFTSVVMTPEEHVEALNGDMTLQKRLAAAGRPGIFHSVRVVANDGADVTPGSVGEIIVKGGNLMSGYWRKPEATAESLRDGWYYTRDLATVDEHGFIYVVDRKSHMIITGAENVYPALVEAVLYEHPKILVAAVLGVPDDKWGEAVKAVVVPREGETLTSDEVIDFCRPRLANYAKPKSVDIVESLPLLPTGKLDRVSLRERYWHGRTRRVN